MFNERNILSKVIGVNVIDNKILLGVLIVLSVVAGVYAFTQQSDQEDNGLNYNSNGKGEKYNFLKPEATYNVLNVAITNCFNQYIGIIYVELNQIDFYENSNEYDNIGSHSFNIPQNCYVSSGYGGNEDILIFSEIYQTSDKTSFGIIIVSNPNYNAEDLVNDFSKDKNLDIQNLNLIKIGSLDNVEVYKFENDGLVYYVYDDGEDIVVIIMDKDNDYLFMFLSDFSLNGEIDPSNPYYPQESENTTEDNQSQDDYSADNSYDSGYDDPYYDY